MFRHRCSPGAHREATVNLGWSPNSSDFLPWSMDLWHLPICENDASAYVDRISEKIPGCTDLITLHPGNTIVFRPGVSCVGYRSCYYPHVCWLIPSHSSRFKRGCHSTAKFSYNHNNITKIVLDFVGLTFTFLLKHETLDMNRGKNCMMLHCQHRISTLLVGGWPTPLKNMKASWDYDIPNIWKVIKQYSKPPTR